MLLLLPLKSDLGDVNRAMGCLIAEGEIGRARTSMWSRPRSPPIVAGAPTPRDTPAPRCRPRHWISPGAFKPFARKPTVERLRRGRRARPAHPDPRRTSCAVSGCEKRRITL
ncbi:MAG: hypothetical protein R3D78_11700 [Paracoccaceae bacterium]